MRGWLTVPALLLSATCAFALRLPEEATGPRVLVYTLWSRQYLCLGARVPDTMLTGSSVAPMSAPEQDDAIEFCVEAPTAKGPAAFRLAISAAGGMTVLRRDASGNWRTEPSWISGPKTVKFAVVTDGTLNQPGDSDNGFVVEAAIPWEFLTGGDAPASQRLGFNVVCWMQGESQGIASWSPMVRSEEEVGDAARWGSLIVSYGSAPTSASGSVIECPFAGITPFVDGRLAAEEWLTASTLAFYKPQPTFTPAPATSAKPAGAGTLLAVYRYDWTGDMNRVGGAKLWASGLAPATPDQPKEACGPWYSYERVAWHRQELEEVTRAGIDVLLARYQGDEVSRQTWADTGLDRLTQALKERRADGRTYPLVGMMLDTAALQGADLKGDSGKRLLYGMIRDFFLHVPPEFRAQLGARPEEGRLGGVPILLGEPDRFTGWDGSFLSYCDQRFGEDFGGGHIAWLGSSEWQKGGVDGFYAWVRLAGKIGLTQEAVGGATAMSVSPGYCVPGAQGEMRSRKEGRGYRTDWQRIVASKPELVVINSWNDFANATEIAPSRQYGYAYVDMTQLFKARLGSELPHYLRLRQGAVPKVMKPGSTYLVEMLIENVGTEEVRTGGHITADYRIVSRADNAVVQERIGAQALVIAPGQTRRLPVEITTRDSQGKPLPPGEYLFSLAVMKTKVSYLRSKWFAKPIAELTVPITVGEPPARQATVISTSLPCAMETGTTESVVVRLRNEGGETWRVGTVKLSYHWLRYGGDLTAPSERARESVTWEGARADLPRDVAPGEVVSVMIPVSATQPDGSPLSPPLADSLSHYRVQWDLVAGGDGWFSRGAGSLGEEAIGLADRDWGVLLKTSTTPAEMTAGQTVEVGVTIANAGPRKWAASPELSTASTVLRGDWRQWDGRQTQWHAEPLPLSREVQPAETVTLKTKLTAPSVAGTYWLVWEVSGGESKPMSSVMGRRDDLLAVPVAVGGGKLRAVDLSSLVNVAAVTTDSYRTRGDFDGRGRSFPAECLPPDLSGAREDLYPAGYYGGAGLEPVPFRFPDASSGVGGAVACAGQRIALGGSGVGSVYLLAASTSEQRSVEMVLNAVDGTSEQVPVTVRSWQQAADARGIGAYAPYVRGLSGDDASAAACLYVLTVRSQKGSKAVSLELPRDPSIKILAVTVEDE